MGTTLAVCGGELVSVGGYKGVVYREVRGGRWTSMPEMLVGCRRSCVGSVSGGVLLVMGGYGGGRRLNVVQIFDGRTCYMGPPLSQPCGDMSAVVHGDLVFVMGGGDMERAALCYKLDKR